jgi:type I restriction enzyme S subunit
MELTKAKYKKTKIGLMPEDWNVIDLSELSNRIGDGIHTTPKYSPTGKYYFVNGNNLDNGRIVFGINTKKVDEEEFKIHKRELNINSLLLSINGTIGSLAFYNNECIVLGKSAAYINLNSKATPKYIYSILQTPFIQKFFENELTGSTIKNLGLAAIRKTPIPLPPTIEEQKAIATALSDVDDLINNLEKLIAKKKVIKHGALQQLLTGKIRIKGFDKMPEKKESIYGKIPSDWKVEKIGNVCDIYGRIGFRGYTVQDIVEEGRGALSLSPSNIINNRIDFNKGTFISWAKYHESPEIKIRTGDIVLVKTASVGKTAIIENTPFKITLNPQLVVLKKLKIDNYFLSYMMTFKIIKDQITTTVAGGVVPTLTQEQIANFTFPKPNSTEEQAAISKILFDMDVEINSLEIKKTKYLNIKQGMMQDLLTGKIRLI